jgi:hypothetical protein
MTRNICRYEMPNMTGSCKKTIWGRKNSVVQLVYGEDARKLRIGA